ncbi:MAG: preprotein translocase subunit SecE [Verrucomicrobiota bacterium]
MSSYTTLLIWVAVIAVVFGIAWRKGLFAKLTQYCAETREELKKCTWPTRDELKGSTIVVLISTLLIGLFTFVVDGVVVYLMRHLLS